VKIRPVPSATLVMARAPIAGRCKTRLQPRLGADGCAALQAALVRRAAAWAVAVAAPGAAYVAYDPPEEEAGIRALVPAGTRLLAQVPGDLGVRLAAAVARIPERPLLVVGTDIPALSEAHARDTLAALEATGGTDAVLGPASDGGWWIAGLGPGTDGAFDRVASEDWGSERAFDATLAAWAAAGLRAAAVPRTEHDLDLPEDADRALADPRVPAEIKAVLRT
jgi:rSAM/selenodomain-associated transferase 1